MIKTIDDITFMGDENSFMLSNIKNSAHFSFNAEKGTVSFQDPFENIVQNQPSTIRINSEIFKLEREGQIINLKNDTIITIAYLSGKDVEELAEKNFYEEGQIRIYDFINKQFNVSLK